MNKNDQTAGRWIYRAIILVLLAANGAVLWFSYQSLALSKHHAEQSAETHAANIAEAVQQNLDTGFEEVDLVIGGIAEEMRRQIVAGKLNFESLSQYVVGAKPSLRQINSVVINNAAGDTLLTIGAVGPKVNVSDRDYFVIAKSPDRPPIIVSKLLFSRISKRYVTLVAHRVEGAGGRFEGVVAGAILASYLQSTISAYDLGSHGSITLRDTNGALIAKYDAEPGVRESEVGSQTTSADFRGLVDSGSKSLILRSYAGSLGTQKISILRRVETAPMVIEVSVGTQDYLRGWWDQVVSTAGLDSGFLLLSLLTGYLLLRSLTRIEQERALFQTARDMAESSNAAKGQFLANMSHELRTPMNAVLGMHELLLSTELTPRQKDYVEKSRTAATSLLDILNGILDFSKIEAGKLDLEAVPFPLENLLRELSVIVSSSLGEKEIELLYEIDPRIPARLIGDPLRLKQVLINLCGNAVKFTQSGEIIVELKLLELESEARIRFSVIDSGLGISDEQKAIIFHAFSQADVSTSRRFGGTGLGLTISQRLVKIMGGTIDVESEPRRGSRFSFTLNLPLAGGPSPQPVSPQRALIVSHNEAARRVFGDMARAAGWDYEIHLTVASAEKSLGHPTPWTVAIVDLWTVETADWMACTRLKSVFPSIRVLGLAHPRQLEAVRASASQPAGFHTFLVKPFTISMLVEAVEEVSVDLPPAAQPLRPRRLEGARLLVAEDNPFNQQVALELLQSEGAVVSIARDGAESLRKLGEGASFDAVLMDMRMPGMDGLEATRLIRQTLGMRELPIIAMTANAMPSDKAACFEAGMDDHVSKPIARDKLVDTLIRYLRRSPDSELPIFDSKTALDRLGGDEATLDKVLAYWLHTAETLPAELRTAAQNPDKLSRYFHSLKSSAATVGGASLSQFAAQIEKRLAEDPRWFQLDVVGPDTEARVAALAREVDQYLKTKVRAS